MKKILIVTYCTWTSIGSIFQSLGLKKALSKMGYDSVILLNKHENEFHLIKINSIKRFIIWVHQCLIYQKRKSSFVKRMKFINDNIDIEYLESENSFEKRAEKDDVLCVLAGSDQIWNPMNINPLFFLDFVKDKKKISYAASMGITSLNNMQEITFHNYLKDFSHVSVREMECKNVLQHLTDKSIEVNIDPVFLCDVEEWRIYEKTYPIDTPYILLYMLYWDEQYKDKIIELKNKTGLKVIAISNQLSKVYADKILYDVGPSEFLWLIDHAEYVISSSFHGVAFSVLFNKKFSAVINPSSPSRIGNLLRTLNISNVKIENLNMFDLNVYSLINNRIKDEKNKSIKYLEKVLLNEYIKK